MTSPTTRIYDPLNKAVVEGKPPTDSDWRQTIMNVADELHQHQMECAKLQRENKLLLQRLLGAAVALILIVASDHEWVKGVVRLLF